jgi:hypothetical protein
MSILDSKIGLFFDALGDLKTGARPSLLRTPQSHFYAPPPRQTAGAAAVRRRHHRDPRWGFRRVESLLVLGTQRWSDGLLQDRLFGRFRRF